MEANYTHDKNTVSLPRQESGCVSQNAAKWGKPWQNEAGWVEITTEVTTIDEI